MHIFLEENFIIAFVFLNNFYIFSTILSRFVFLTTNLFFAFCLSLFLKYCAIKLLVLCALLYYLDVLL